MQNKVDEVKKWLRKAENDIALAERALKGSPCLTDGAVFHCQQAAEKALKAFLTWHEITFAKTHQLIPLVMEAKKINKDFEKLRDAAASLSPYAVLYRYPG